MLVLAQPKIDDEDQKEANLESLDNFLTEQKSLPSILFINCIERSRFGAVKALQQTIHIIRQSTWSSIFFTDHPPNCYNFLNSRVNQKQFSLTNSVELIFKSN